MTYRVREYTRDLKGPDGKVNFKNYYVYCSDEFTDYYEALEYAVNYEKKINKCWVDCIDTYQYFEGDGEGKKEFGFV